MVLPFSFARPWMLVVLALLPALVVLTYRAGKRRRALLRLFGTPEAVAALSSLRGRRRGRARLAQLGAVLLLVIGLAGPRWGRGDPGVVIGRDLMIVLDLSKSMLAGDMRDPALKERWRAARAGIHDLVETIRQRGGHRVGLVVFAQKPWLVCPLTADYDLLLLRLDEYDPVGPPREVNPDKDRGEQFPSGTRIGSALEYAVAWHDPRFPGYQDLLLISDGDDPAEDRDSEIEAGIEAARKVKIPVHVVGLGDPDNAVTASYKRADGEEDIVGPTKLHEAPLREIARRTDGLYLEARRETPRLGEFFKARIELRPTRELPDDALPQPKERYLWFLIPAVVLLLGAWLIEP